MNIKKNKTDVCVQYKFHLWDGRAIYISLM